MGRNRGAATSLPALAWLSSVCPVAAFEIGTPIDLLQLRWDNSLRYNAAWRVQDQDPALLANPSLDNGNRNFDRGLVSSRFDLPSELDAFYDNLTDSP